MYSALLAMALICSTLITLLQNARNDSRDEHKIDGAMQADWCGWNRPSEQNIVAVVPEIEHDKSPRG
jgi:hypothetical protein